MPILTVLWKEEDIHLPFERGPSMREILDVVDLSVRSGCRGIGACGLCRVQIVKGKVPPPTSAEKLHLSGDQLEQEVRLACQVRPEQELKIKILNPAPRSKWKALLPWRKNPAGRCPVFSLRDLPGDEKERCGVAVDLGTTNISLSICAFSNGERIAGRYGLNPQMSFGYDVVTRIEAAAESPEVSRVLHQQLIDAIREALLDIASREGIDLKQIVYLTHVGNTAMLSLLSGRNYELLLHPDYMMRPIDCLPDDTSLWSVSWGVHPEAVIEVIPPLAGFVGSDLLAGVVTTRLIENGAGALLIDFGTNSEIALWDGSTLWVTSAAGGPAFEGCGISCGLSAEPGAIYQVRIEEGSFDFDVIGSRKACGICGSGMVDFIACLIRSGGLTEMGRFAPEISRKTFALTECENRIVLTKVDVDVFQRAKAAIGAGIKVLLNSSGMEFGDLKRICVCGAFGRYLNIVNAQEIGLLPKVQTSLFELCGNTALAGCEEIMLSSEALEYVSDLKNKAKIVNLAECGDFEDLFLESLYLRPMGDS